MLPEIYIFGKSVSMYALATAAGVLLAVLYLQLRLRGQKKLLPDAELGFVYALVGAVVGAKLLYLLTCLPELLRELPYLFSATGLFLEKYLYGGFVFYGGLFGAFLALRIYCRAEKLDYWELVRLMLPMFPLIHAFGRIGCFCAGCCYGVHTDLFFGVTFTHSAYAPAGDPLVPVQLFEAAGEALLFLWTAVCSYRGKPGRFMLGWYLLAYAVLRFVLEFFRGDSYRGFVGALSTSQLISLFVAGWGLFLLLTRRRKQRKPA